VISIKINGEPRQYSEGIEPWITRRPTLAEQRIFDLWDTLGLNEPAYSGGQLIGFVKQLRRNT